MKEAIIRTSLDLFYAACYIFLTHAGYDIVDKISDNKPNTVVNIIVWVVAATVLFFLTKKRYDKEVEEGKNEDEV